MAARPNYTELYIDSLLSAKGGWTRISIEKLGLKWPPKKGWRKELIARDALMHEYICQSCWLRQDSKIQEITEPKF